MNKELKPEEAIAKALRELDSNQASSVTKAKANKINPDIGYISWMLFTQLRPEIFERDYKSVFEEYVCFVGRLDLWNQLCKLSAEVLDALSEVSFKVSRGSKEQP